MSDSAGRGLSEAGQAQNDVELLLTITVDGKNLFMPDDQPDVRYATAIWLCRALRNKTGHVSAPARVESPPPASTTPSPPGATV